MTAKVTLYIPCHKLAAQLSFCLDGVFAQDYFIDEVLEIRHLIERNGTQI